MLPAPNFTTSFTVTQTPREAFNAIKNVRAWWSEEMEGGSRIVVIEVIPDTRIVWYVLDNYFNFAADESDWTDTKIVFEISSKEGETQVRFTHQGLVPAYECCDVCCDAWGSYINGSLRSLITTGKGRPKKAEVSSSGVAARGTDEFSVSWWLYAWDQVV